MGLEMADLSLRTLLTEMLFGTNAVLDLLMCVPLSSNTIIGEVYAPHDLHEFGCPVCKVFLILITIMLGYSTGGGGEWSQGS